MRNLFIIFGLIGSLIFVSDLTAQTLKRSNNPYSYFGIGEIRNPLFGMNRALGNISSGLRTPLNINLGNPASLGALRRSTVEVGGEINGHWFDDGTVSQSMADFNLAYLTIAFPITKFWGSSIGLVPFSASNYEILTVNEIDGIGAQATTFQGTGATYQFYWSNGFTFKNISAGVHAAYIFGSTNEITTTEFLDVDGILPYQITNNNKVGGLIWKAGVQYHPQLTDKLSLSIGATFSTGSQLQNTQNYMIERLSIGYGDIEIEDSIPLISIEDVESKFKMPANYSFGAVLNHGNRWLLGFDVKMNLWSDTDILIGDIGKTTNQYEIGVAAGFIPYRTGIKTFLNQTQYRFGLQTSNNYFTINGQQVQNMAVTFGAGLPISKRRPSRLNLAFEVGRQGNLDNGLIQETYVKTTIGFSLNDLWFIKPKFD